MKYLLALLFAIGITSFATGQNNEPDDDGFRAISRGEDYSRKWALIVGVNYDGQTEEWQLKNPENDATAVYTELKENKGFECQLLLGKNANRANVLGAISKLKRSVGEDDCFLLYFAGHGTTNEACPVIYPFDFNEGGEIVNAIRADEIVSEQIKARHSLFMFDSCYSGKIVDIPYRNLSRRQTSPKFEGRSIQILTAAANNQKAKDGGAKLSPFATAFLDALEHQEGGRISAGEVHKLITDRLTGQTSVFETFVPGRESVAAGEFYFIGKRRISPTNKIVFQTLGGSQGTLAGSPLSRSWFDETPWLTPAIRLVLDGTPQGSFPRPKSTAPTHDQQRSVIELIGAAQEWLDSNPSIDEHTLKVSAALRRLPEAKDKGAVVAAALSAMNTRDGDASPTELHTIAILECARHRYQNEPETNDAKLKVEELFDKAVAAYERDKRVGLQTRCLADHAHWLVENKEYDKAISVYGEALALVADADDAQRLRMELLAGIAMSCRQAAKRRLAKAETPSEDDRIAAQRLWNDAGSYYENMKACIDEYELAEAVPARAYFHERLAWLNMDLWNLTEAQQNFAEAISLREKTQMDLVGFLCYANSKQGVAMVDQMTGQSGKEGLRATQILVAQRLKQASEDQDSASVLYGRLCNTIERLGDCDFVAGRQQLLGSIGTYRAGLDACDEWLRTASTARDRETIRVQRLRFLCKTVIAASAAGRSEICREMVPELKREREQAEVESGVLLVLCDFADAFANYCQSRITCNGASGCQSAIDAIRAVVHKHSVASLDREAAEILLMASSIVSEEQQRQDAIVLRKLLPKDASGKPPSQISQKVREQYDRVVMLQGKTYAGKVSSWREFEKFRDLILNLQGDLWTRTEKDGPHVLFFFPIDGSHGLVILSNGLEEGADEVYPLGFGWNEIGELSEALVKKLGKLLRDNSSVKVGWASDEMLTNAGFDVAECPFLK